MSHISAHADYRHEDYFFQRSQSRALSALEWEQSDKPLRSWSEFLYPAVDKAERDARWQRAMALWESTPQNNAPVPRPTPLEAVASTVTQ